MIYSNLWEFMHFIVYTRFVIKIGQSGILSNIKENDDDWKISLLRVLPMSLQGSSCFLVSLIVYFRLLITKNPLKLEQEHRRLGRVVSIGIWVLSVLMNLIPCFASINKTGGIREDDIRRRIFSGSFLIVIHTTVTAPLLLTVIFYLIILRTFRSSGINISIETKRKTKSLTKFIHGIVCCLLICNIPYIVWYQYVGQLAIDGEISSFLVTTEGVCNTH